VGIQTNGHKSPKKRVKLATDDFGTGCSSLSQLRRLPFDNLKIDQSFVIDLEQDDVLVKSIVKLGHHLGLQVLAEGVKNQNQSNGCKN
jgi:diguanylate cyclase